MSNSTLCIFSDKCPRRLRSRSSRLFQAWLWKLELSSGSKNLGSFYFYLDLKKIQVVSEVSKETLQTFPLLVVWLLIKSRSIFSNFVIWSHFFVSGLKNCRLGRVLQSKQNMALKYFRPALNQMQLFCQLELQVFFAGVRFFDFSKLVRFVPLWSFCLFLKRYGHRSSAIRLQNLLFSSHSWPQSIIVILCPANIMNETLLTGIFAESCSVVLQTVANSPSLFSSLHCPFSHGLEVRAVACGVRCLWFNSSSFKMFFSPQVVGDGWKNLRTCWSKIVLFK